MVQRGFSRRAAASHTRSIASGAPSLTAARTPPKSPSKRLQGRVSDTYNRQRRVGALASHSTRPRGPRRRERTSRTRASARRRSAKPDSAPERRVDAKPPPKRPPRAPARAAAARRVKATDPEPMALGRRGRRRSPPPRHRRDARKLEELPKEDKMEFDPFATLRARGGAGTEFMKGKPRLRGGE